MYRCVVLETITFRHIKYSSMFLLKETIFRVLMYNAIKWCTLSLLCTLHVGQRTVKMKPKLTMGTTRPRIVHQNLGLDVPRKCPLFLANCSSMFKQSTRPGQNTPSLQSVSAAGMGLANRHQPVENAATQSMGPRTTPILAEAGSRRVPISRGSGAIRFPTASIGAHSRSNICLRCVSPRLQCLECRLRSYPSSCLVWMQVYLRYCVNGSPLLTSWEGLQQSTDGQGMPYDPISSTATSFGLNSRHLVMPSSHE